MKDNADLIRTIHPTTRSKMDEGISTKIKEHPTAGKVRDRASHTLLSLRRNKRAWGFAHALSISALCSSQLITGHDSTQNPEAPVR